MPQIRKRHVLRTALVAGRRLSAVGRNKAMSAADRSCRDRRGEHGAGAGEGTSRLRRWRWASSALCRCIAAPGLCGAAREGGNRRGRAGGTGGCSAGARFCQGVRLEEPVALGGSLPGSPPHAPPSLPSPCQPLPPLALLPFAFTRLA